MGTRKSKEIREMFPHECFSFCSEVNARAEEYGECIRLAWIERSVVPEHAIAPVDVGLPRGRCRTRP